MINIDAVIPTEPSRLLLQLSVRDKAMDLWIRVYVAHQFEGSSAVAAMEADDAVELFVKRFED